MPLILSLDTSLQNAAICLSEDALVVNTRTNNNQEDHAAWIHNAVISMMEESQKSFSELSAVAVAEGPGSYTGLRVGMATAKGFCYALDIPLITESVLKLTAYRVLKEGGNFGYALPVLICPMVDARRMEVYTAGYDGKMHEKIPPKALILDETSFRTELQTNTVIFCGNGSTKWQTICRHPNAVFETTLHQIGDLAERAAGKYLMQEFTDIAYSEPAYLKSVYTGSPKQIN